MNTTKNFYCSTMLLIIAGISLFSCKMEESSIPLEESSKIKFVEHILVSLPSAQKKKALINGTILGVFDESKEKVLSFNLSQNILNSLEMSNEQFTEILSKKLYESQAKSNRGDHSECISNCIEKFTDEDGKKIKGRGSCKFACWVDTVVTIIKAIGDDIVKGVL